MSEVSGLNLKIAFSELPVEKLEWPSLPITQLGSDIVSTRNLAFRVSYRNSDVLRNNFAINGL